VGFLVDNIKYRSAGLWPGFDPRSVLVEFLVDNINYRSAGLWPGFDPRSVLVEFRADNIALHRLCSKYFNFLCQYHSINSSFSFFYHLHQVNYQIKVSLNNTKNGKLLHLCKGFALHLLPEVVGPVAKSV